MSQDAAVSMAATGPRTTPEPLYGGASTGRRVTVRDIAAAKARGEKWPMLTAYDALTAGTFDQAGIPVLLVGDSAAMVVYGHDTTIPVTVDDLIPLTAAVVRGTRRALVVVPPQGAERFETGLAGPAARVPWEQVERADWDRETERFRRGPRSCRGLGCRSVL